MLYFSNPANYAWTVPAEGQYYLLPSDYLPITAAHGVLFLMRRKVLWLDFSQMTMDLHVWIPGSSLKGSATSMSPRPAHLSHFLGCLHTTLKWLVAHGLMSSTRTWYPLSEAFSTSSVCNKCCADYQRILNFFHKVFKHFCRNLLSACYRKVYLEFNDCRQPY